MTLEADDESKPKLGSKLTTVYLKKFGFRAATIVDVGVNHGTNALYNLCKGSTLVLIDPIADCAQRVRLRRPRLKFLFVEAGLGSSEGEAELSEYDRDGLNGILERTALTAHPVVRRRKIRTTTLDRVVSENNLAGPFGLKIDTEGYELEVPKGAAETLSQTEFVIVEASLLKRFVSNYRFSEIVATLAAHGLELIDILNPQNNVPRYADYLFLRVGHPAFEGKFV